MSVQFGRCNFDGKAVDPGDLAEVRPVLAPYGPDGEGFICKDNFAVLYRAFHTTKASRREIQPHLCSSGAVITWDGRLDNREELVGLLAREISLTSTDLEIVAAAYERWGTSSFAKLIGDWALSIWEPEIPSLLLAKDFMGTRHLYYSLQKDRVTWCTILDPLVLFAHRSLEIEEEYVAGWLSFFPAPHLTPYVGIWSVPPSSFVRLSRGMTKSTRYWDFDPAKRIRYRSDAQYEEHFRTVFFESVRRRLRSDCPVLAELSGGMDSSAVVCIADQILARGLDDNPRLDTLSYYDDSEPNWNERPYFRKVEEKRGRSGCHIDVSAQSTLIPQYEEGRFSATPKSVGLSRQAAIQFSHLLATQQNRVLLCGTGGDEVLGGLPNPTPELATLLATGDLRNLGKQIVVWALATRRSLLHLASETVRAFMPVTWRGIAKDRGPAGWLYPLFVKRNWPTFQGYERRLKVFGPLPSFQDAMGTLEALQRQLACSPPSSQPVCETRYPYLDRDFLEYVYAIPRQQLVRPGQRRSLMRRALSGIVPEQILNRRRKAFVIRGPLTALSKDWPSLVEMTSQMISDVMHIVDRKNFVQAMEKAVRGQEIPVVTMTRTIRIEYWLRHLANFDFMQIPLTVDRDPIFKDVIANPLVTSNHSSKKATATETT
jgi:asparagine synthase (glutamine-hydrolysing)